MNVKRPALITAYLVLAVGMFVGFLVWRGARHYFEKEEDPRSQEYLSQIAAEINRSVPLMIDKETELMPRATASCKALADVRRQAMIFSKKA